MVKKRRPQLTLEALDGLTKAMSELEAGDLLDETEEATKQRQAADKFIRDMYQFFQNRDQ